MRLRVWRQPGVVSRSHAPAPPFQQLFRRVVAFPQRAQRDPAEKGHISRPLHTTPRFTALLFTAVPPATVGQPASADLATNEYGGGLTLAAAAGAAEELQQGDADAAAAAAAAAHGGDAPGDGDAAAAAAAAAGPSSSTASLQKQTEQLPYAAVREAAAVNQAADGAADEAMCAVTAAQATIQALLNPAPMMMHDDGMGHHHGRGHGGGGRSRRGGRAAAVAAIHFDAYGMPIYGAPTGGRQNKGLRHFSMKVGCISGGWCVWWSRGGAAWKAAAATALPGASLQVRNGTSPAVPGGRAPDLQEGAGGQVVARMLLLLAARAWLLLLLLLSVAAVWREGGKRGSSCIGQEFFFAGSV
jgi:hypothetical protein